LAVDDIVSHPQGGGVGTAGPADFYNPGIARIAENYFLQIGQEAGIIGMALFIAICLFVGGLLYKLRAEPLAMALFVSLIGITFVNLLSHAWTDDTLAYIWWGLAGVALAPILAGRQKANGKKRKT
jgi:O-antigen ligase